MPVWWQAQLGDATLNVLKVLNRCPTRAYAAALNLGGNTDSKIFFASCVNTHLIIFRLDIRCLQNLECYVSDISSGELLLYDLLSCQFRSSLTCRTRAFSTS
jgi:hypothetical protein